MGSCNCIKYKDLDGQSALRDRAHNSKKIINELSLISEHNGGEHKLYQCSICSQLWQRSLDWTSGNKQYVFKVPVVSIKEWNEKPFVQPDELFARVGHIQLYLERGNFEEQEAKCRKDDCSNHAIKLSVLCLYHHMLNLGFKSEMEDTYSWFDPYFKNNYEFTMDYLKTLPNYKPY